MIDAKTKLFGLLGNPLGHSLSPFMQNHYMEECGVNGVYLAFPVEAEELGNVIKGMHAMGVVGANVTIPYKEQVIPYLCGMSPAAKACGAVNTLIYTPEGYYGDNTDGAGLLAALEAKYGWNAEEERILLVGAGGAAKGVSVAMALKGAKKICIVNRSPLKAKALAEQIAKLSQTETEAKPYEALEDPELYKEYTTVVNTTSLGMSPHVDERIPVCMEALGETHLVVDLVYNPFETKLLREAAAQGAKTASGLGMFLFQGILAFEAWTGKRPKGEIMEKMLIEELTEQRK